MQFPPYTVKSASRVAFVVALGVAAIHLGQVFAFDRPPPAAVAEDQQPVAPADAASDR